MKILVCFMILSLLVPYVPGPFLAEKYAAAYASEVVSSSEGDSGSSEGSSGYAESSAGDSEGTTQESEGTAEDSEGTGEEIEVTTEDNEATTDDSETIAEESNDASEDATDEGTVTEDGSGVAEGEESDATVETPDIPDVTTVSVAINVNIVESLMAFGLAALEAVNGLDVRVFEVNDLWIPVTDNEGNQIAGIVTDGKLILDGFAGEEYYRFFVSGLPEGYEFEEDSEWIAIELAWSQEILTGYYQDIFVPANGLDLNIGLTQSDDVFVLQELETYTVRFMLEGAVFDEYEVEEGSPATEIGTPDMSLWPAGMLSFLGWFKEGAINSFEFNQPVTGDITLFARFSNQYMIKFKDDRDGPIIDTIMVSPGRPVPQTNVVVPPPAGYRLLYWVLEGTTNPGDPASAFVFGLPATGNITLVPHFSDNYYVVFISEGTQVEPQVVAAGGTVVVPKEPTRSGWTFAGWFSKGVLYDFNTPVNEDLILNTKWTSNTVNYTVALWMEVPNYANGNPAAKPNPPTAGGSISDYNYIGSLTLTGTAGSMTDIAANKLPPSIVSLFDNTSSVPTGLLKYAEYQSAENKIVQGNGSTVVNLYASRKVYTYAFNLGDQPGFSMTIGGATYNSGPGRPQYQLNVKYEMDIYSKFPVQGVDFVSYNGGFSSWYRPLGMPEISNIGSRRNVVDASMLGVNGQTLNYEFEAAWLPELPEFTYRYLAQAYPGQTYPANRTIVLNGVTYVVMDMFSQTYRGDLNQKAINGLTRVVVDSIWDSQWLPYNYSEMNGFTPATTLTNSSYRCFFYTRNLYNLTFVGNPPPNAQGAVTNLPATRTLVFEQPVGQAPANPPLLDGYTFMGWYRDADLRESFSFDMIMPNSNVTAYAKWESQAFTIHYYEGIGGELIATQGVEPGGYVDFDDSRLPQINDIEPGKGQFAGWFWFVGGIPVEYNPSIPVFKDIHLFAKWLTNGFTVTYDADGGIGTVPVENDTYALGVYAPVLPGTGLIKGGDLFSGWKAFDQNNNPLDGGRTYYPGNTIEMNGNVKFVAQYLNRGD
ncbi:MAG: InlB B-repeat-containing protein, partial [Peptococcaceae bacterium]|nr:InlB B-repeat-containing protein [Peptococcaceae bacterium]